MSGTPGRPQPQRLTHARPLESAQLPPDQDQDQDQHELPDEPGGDADQERLREWVITCELIPEPGSDDPCENPHRDGRTRPHREDLSEYCLTAAYRASPGSRESSIIDPAS
jgi:hypothetical protein